MLEWMTYALGVSLLVGLAAAAAERALRMRGAQVRGVWLLALVGSVAIPLLAVVLGTGGPPDRGLVVTGLEGVVPPMPALEGAAAQTASDAGIELPSLDVALGALWGISAVAAIGWLFWSALALRRRLRELPSRAIGRVRWHVSDESGPAALWSVTGAAHVLVPSWFRQLDADKRRLALAHEREHLRRGDSLVVALAFFLAGAAPWCLPLWWQAFRLRRAVEVDCDRRVLAGGADPKTYGELLLETGAIQSGWSWAMEHFGRSPGLRDRVLQLTSAPGEGGRFRVASLLAVAVSAVVVAVSVPVPDVSPVGVAGAEPGSLAASADAEGVEVVPLDEIGTTADGDTINSLIELADRGLQVLARVEYRYDAEGRVRDLRILNRGESRRLNRMLSAFLQPAPGHSPLAEDEVPEDGGVVRHGVIFNPRAILDMRSEQRARRQLVNRALEGL